MLSKTKGFFFIQIKKLREKKEEIKKPLMGGFKKSDAYISETVVKHMAFRINFGNALSLFTSTQFLKPLF